MRVLERDKTVLHQLAERAFARAVFGVSAGRRCCAARSDALHWQTARRCVPSVSPRAGRAWPARIDRAIGAERRTVPWGRRPERACWRAASRGAGARWCGTVRCEARAARFAAHRSRSGDGFVRSPGRGPASQPPAVPVGKRSAQRPQGAEATGIVTRRAKTAQRASWSRAGRSPARRNRARRPAAGRAVAHTPKNQPPPRHGANPQNPNPHVNIPGPERRRRDPGEESPQAGPPGKRAPASAGEGPPQAGRSRGRPGRRERSERGFCFCRCGGTKGAAGRVSDERLSSGARLV